EFLKDRQPTFLRRYGCFSCGSNRKCRRCHIAKRGKNKQKRMDLRQIGLALVVTKDDMIPLFHHSYEGNMNDAKVFRKVIEKIKNRLEAIGADTKSHTIVFDRGNLRRDKSWTVYH